MLGTGMIARRKARRPLLSSCAVAGALVVTGQAGPASAESYMGSATTVAGTASVDQTPVNRTVITVSGSSAVINWTPTQAPDANGVIAFQNAGTIADFQSDGGDYTVLNRILPGGSSNPVSFNGDTKSYIGSFDSGSPTIGGHIWFYSPGGIIVGATGTFDVGSLGLSTLDISNNDFTSGVGSGLYHFQPALNDHAMISIAAGGNLLANSTNAYIALVSPRIDMAGTVTANGSIAYVAGTQTDITIHDGLFDINVTQGSPTDGTAGDATVLSHTGTTTGAAPTSTAAQHAIYMVAIPKNNAITMLVGGNVGFEAASAGVVNGTVVLEGGSNVTTQNYPSATYYNDIGNSAPVADTNIVLDGVNLTSTAQMFADGTIDAHSTATSPLSTTSNLLLTATRAVTLESGAGQTVDIGGNLSLVSPGAGPDADGNAVGGSASIVSNGGTITVGGDTNLDASASGGYDEATDTSGSGTGGTASVTINDGSLDTGALTVNAEGDGDGFGGSLGGAGTGGTASVGTSGNGAITVSTLTVSASGYGGTSDTGGLGQGGQANVVADGTGGIEVAGNVQITAYGQGGAGLNTSAGNGVGGSVLLETVNGGTFRANVEDGTLALDASGQGGYDGSEGFGTVVGGNGTGGTASILANNGSISARDTTVYVTGTGADGSTNYGYYGDSDAAAGGDATGGKATIQTAGATIALGALTVNAGADAGYGGDAYEIYTDGTPTGTSANAGAGGNAVGGSIEFLASAGSITTSSTSLITSGNGGNGGTSDFATAGAGGNGTGGGASDPTAGVHVTLSGGTMTLGAFNLDSSGFGGTAGTGNAGSTGAASGNGTGGLIDVTMGSNLSALPTLTLTATGQGADSDGDAQASGGDGQGGSISFTQNAGTLITNTLSFDASGQGGSVYGPSETGGAGNGGSVNVLFGDQNLSNGLTLFAKGTGGQGGGAAGGGQASLIVDNTAIGSGSSILISADAYGGGNSYGAGGAATAGSASLTVRNGGTVDDGTDLYVSAHAGGGYGMSGGDATGGTAKIDLAQGGLSAGGDLGANLYVDASANGGNGSLSGGAGTGGTASLAFDAGTNDVALEIDGTATITAAGIGGNTLSSESGTPARGPAGLGTGGTASLDVANGTASFNALVVDASGSGGLAQDGGASGDGVGGTASISTGADDGNGGISTGSIRLTADGTGGGPFSEDGYGQTLGGDGGNGTGGIATLTVAGEGISGLGDLILSATGIGGAGTDTQFSTGPTDNAGGQGGNGLGGTVTLTVTGTALTGNTLSLDASGIGGNGGSGDGNTGGLGGDGGSGLGGGHDGTAGRVSAIASSGASLGFGTITATADGFGGSASFGTGASNGGAGTGGQARLGGSVNGGSADSGTSALVSAIGRGGDPINGGTGGFSTGGFAEYATHGGNANFTEVGIHADAGGNDDGPNMGSGAQGGTANFTLDGGGATITNFLELTADATSARGGDATGGAATFRATDGAEGFFDSFALSPSAQAFGSGGAATGGTAAILVSGAGTDIEVGYGSTLSANAVNATGATGLTKGGTGLVTVSDGARLAFAGNLLVNVSATGPDQPDDRTGDGGAGQGGSITVTADGGALSAANYTLDADGSGGAARDGGVSGAGTGGTISVGVDEGGSISTGGSFSASAQGIGGSAEQSESGATGSDGGLGQGGSISVDIGSGSFGVSGTTSLLADGLGGGAGSGGTGGTGQGGSILLASSGGSDTGGVLTLGTVTLDATGVGGTPVAFDSYSATAANGGSGFGGNITLDLRGALLSADTLAADASGIGTSGQYATLSNNVEPGDAGNGGTGQGGIITIGLNGGTLSTSEGTTLTANGTGGDGGNAMYGFQAGSGGDGIGGEIDLIVDGASSTLDAAGITAGLSGTAGNGGGFEAGYGAPTVGSSGGDGGSAIGGTLALTAQDGGTLDIFSVTTTIAATAGNGGSASDGDLAGTAGNGGDATGGTIRLSSINAGSLLTASGDGITAGLSATGGTGGNGANSTVAGNPGSAGGNGGDGTGGTFEIRAAGGTIDFGDTHLVADGTGGNGSDGGTGAAPGVAGTGTGGSISIDVSDDEENGAFGHFSAGATTLETNGFGGSFGFGGTIHIGTTSQDEAPSLLLGDFAANTRGDSNDIIGGIDISADTGAISVAGNADLESDGDIMISGTDSGRIAVSGAFILKTLGSIQIDQSGAIDTDTPIITSGALNAFASGSFLNNATSAISADDAIQVAAYNAVTTGSLVAGNDPEAPDGTVTVRSGFDGEDFHTVGDTLINGTVSGRSVFVDSGGTITANGNASIFADDTINFRSGGDITLAAGSAVGSISDDAGPSQLPAGLLRSLALSPARGPAQNVTITAGGTPGVGDPETAGLQVDGTVDGVEIALNSAAISLGSAARIGSASTDTLTFTNTGTGQTFIGGDGTGAPYALSNAGLAGAKANVIRVVAFNFDNEQDGPAVVVQDLDLVGSAGGDTANLIGDDARFAIQTTGGARVEGAVQFTSVGAGDTFALAANSRIDVVTPSGSISLFDPSNAAAGTIQLGADIVTVASAQAIADLESLTTIADKDKRLGTNDGAVNQDGYLQAGGLAFNVGSGLFIQNSGVSVQPSTSRAGFTVGSGGVTIFASPSDGPPTQIVINGRQLQANGTYATGAKLIPLLNIQGSSVASSRAFNQGSTANGCLIVGASCQFDVPPVIPPIQDVINTVINPNGGPDKERGSFSVVQQLNAPVIDLAEFAPYDFAPMIDEPVTGAGNDDFWMGADTGTPPGGMDAPQGNIDEQVTSTRRDEDEQQKNKAPKP